MLIYVIILSVVALFLLGGLLFACHQIAWEREYNSALVQELEEAGANYKALEEGRDEETEAWEQEILDYDDRIAALCHERDDLISKTDWMTEEILFHRDLCLPDLSKGVEFDPDNEEPTPVFDELFDIVYG
jgi:hypothetical protein